MTVPVVLALVTIMLTVAGTMAGRGRTTTAAWMAPLYGGLILVVIGLATYVVNDGERRDRERQREDHDKCVELATRSAGLHKSTIRLYDALDFLIDPKYTNEPIIPGEPSLRDGLNIDLPVLDPDDCQEP